MRFLFYTHSLVSDWNHGNAHFLRGVMRELVALGHEAVALETAGGWSRNNLESDQGVAATDRFAHDFPTLRSVSYGPRFAHEAIVADADVVVVHEWTEPDLVSRIGRARREGGHFTLLFHDTHHRAVSQRDAIDALDLGDYDGVLAFGEALRQRYVSAGWGDNVFTWHEAADTRLFRPIEDIEPDSDLVWIGNWGDGERTAELNEFLVEPARKLGIRATIRGVRYPAEAVSSLAEAGLDYGGWIANADVPKLFARHRATVHIPRRPYVEALPGIPTIRVFEALACGIPLVSAPWDDVEHLFRPGKDFLFAPDGNAMTTTLRDLLNDPELRHSLAESGLETIAARHTCRHRVEELLAILDACGTGRVRHELSMEAAE